MTREKTKFLNHFVKDLLVLGINPGGILMVHPALSPFVHVPGGATTIIQGLQVVLGKEGTLLMPSLSWNNVTREDPVFDIMRTPSCVGAIAEAFRLYRGVKRSLHPTHSVCSIGPQTDKFLASHSEDHTPCGPNSPFNKLPRHCGQILMLACGLRYNTSMHAIEEIVEPLYLFGNPITYTLIDENGKSIEKEYIPHNFIGWRQRYDRIEKILKPPGLKKGKIVGVDSYLIQTDNLWDLAIPALQEDELFFIDKVMD